MKKKTMMMAAVAMMGMLMAITGCTGMCGMKECSDKKCSMSETKHPEGCSCEKCGMTEMKHAEGCDCEKCSMPAMQHPKDCKCEKCAAM